MTLSARQQEYLRLMGVELWLPRHGGVAASAAPAGSSAADVDAGGADWETLRREVAACVKCELHKGRTQTVFGVGNTRAGADRGEVVAVVDLGVDRVRLDPHRDRGAAVA